MRAHTLLTLHPSPYTLNPSPYTLHPLHLPSTLTSLSLGGWQSEIGKAMGVDAGMPETVFESSPSVSQETTDEVNQVRPSYLTSNGSRKSTPTRNHQLIVLIGNNKQ